MLILRLLLAAIFLTAGFAQTIAQDVANIPACAISCLSPAITAAGCGQADWVCICGSGKAAVRARAFSCIVADCSTSDALKTQGLADAICVIALGNSSTVTSSATSTQATATTFSTASITSNSTRTAAPSGSILPTTNTTSFSRAPLSTQHTSSSSTSAAPEATISPPASLAPSGRRLSKGAIAGIAVGATIGGLLLIALAGFIIFGCRKRSSDLKHLTAMAIAGSTVNRKSTPDGPYELSALPHVEQVPDTEGIQRSDSQAIVSPISASEPDIERSAG